MTSHDLLPGKKRLFMHNMHTRWSNWVGDIYCTYIATGWTKEMVVNLPVAVGRVVERNPVLKSRLLPKSRVLDEKLFIEEDYFIVTPTGSPFCFVHDLRNSVKESPDNITSQSEGLKYFDKYIDPVIRKEVLGGKESRVPLDATRDRTPLFRVDLFLLPSSTTSTFTVAYRFCLSHLYGDSYTFARLIGQVSEELNKLCGNADIKPEPDLQWMECVNYNKVNGSIYSMRAGLLNLAREAILKLETPEPVYVALSNDQINHYKKVLLNKDRHKYLTSNDIVTAAMCQEFQDSMDLISMAFDVRGREPGITPTSAGWYTTNQSAPTHVMCDPNEVRDFVKDERYYGTPKAKGKSLPYSSIVLGRSFGLSNVAKHGYYIENRAANVKNLVKLDEMKLGSNTNHVLIESGKIILKIVMRGFERPRPGGLLAKISEDYGFADHMPGKSTDAQQISTPTSGSHTRSKL